VFDEVLFVGRELRLPIDGVLAHVDFFGRPKARFGLFVNAPNVVVLNGKENETIAVFS
jgi:hypothetical protein